MRVALPVLAAALIVTGAPTASADNASPTAPITQPGQTSPQVLTPPAGMRSHAAKPGGGTAALGQPCTGYTSNTVPPSTIRVYRTGLGRVDVVDFKTYVKNSLPKEWVPSWKPESLKAGAMAVKTYAWYRVLHWKGGSAGGTCYDLRDDTADQVYVPGSALTATSAAVDATWGVRMAKNGNIFEASYCSNMYCTFSGDTCGANTNGVRLSQWGSQACASNGEEYQKILARYYYSGLTFASTAASPAPPKAVTSWSSAGGDLTGDGRADLLLRDSGGNLVLHQGSGSGNIGSVRVIAGGFNAYRGGVRADFTGDGRQDVIAQRPDGSAVVYKGTGTIGAPLGSPTATTVPWPVDSRLVSAGDTNGDAKADVYGITPSGALVFYAGNGNATFKAGVTVAGGWNRFKSVFAPGVLAGTSRRTLVGADATNGALLIYQANTTGSLTYQRSVFTGWNAFDTVSATGNFAGGGRDLIGLAGAKGKLSIYRSTTVATSPFAWVKDNLGSWGSFNALF